MNILPSNNKSLYGYKEIFSNLKELFDNSRLPNKIIFSGEKGIGKSTLAYHLTNYIFSLCEENKYDFDNNCIDVNNYSYNLILKNTHPNFFFISNDADKNNIQAHMDVVMSWAKATGKRLHVHVDQLNIAEESETEVLINMT